MSEQNHKSVSPQRLQDETKKLMQEKAKLTILKFPSNFPIQNLMCHEDHKEVFEQLFGEDTSRS